jgi:hypothetical protein
MREIIRTKHGENAFNEILDYITKNSGPINSNKVYEKLVSRTILGGFIEKCVGTHGLNNVAEHPQTL